MSTKDPTRLTSDALRRAFIDLSVVQQAIDNQRNHNARVPTVLIELWARRYQRYITAFDNWRVAVKG